jgi:hypothetical protein
MISPFDTLAEVNTHLTAAKAALIDLMSGKEVRLSVGGGDRTYKTEDLDKLQAHVAFLSKERAKFLKTNRPVTVQGRPAR